MMKGQLSGGKKLESYVISQKILGRGSFGVVCESTDRKTSKLLAVKIVGKIYGTLRDLNDFKKEAEILSSLNHPHILHFDGFFEDSTSIYLFTEKLNGGELFNKLVEEDGFSEKEAKTISRKIVSAIAYCHSNNVVHRDIKAENVLFSSKNNNLDLRLIDFGFASIAEGMSLKGELGTPDYMAPEIWGGDKYYGAPVDMWAFGVLVYMTLVSYPPFLHSTPMGVKNKIKRGIYEFHPEYWSKVSEEAKDFVTRLLTVDMNTRMTAEQALLHPWLAPDKPTGGKEFRALMRIGTDIMKFPYGMTASGKDSIRSKAEKMRPLSSAPMAVNRMKALYRLRKNKNQEYNPTDAADRSAGWYLQSLSSDSACDYYCEEKHYTSSGDTNCKDQVSKATLKTGYLTDAELKLSLMKPHSCSRNYWASKVPQSKSEGNLMDVALYAMSSASFCSTVSGTSTDCESYGASSRSKSRSGSSCNSDDEEANYDFSQILLELDREERSDSETD